MEGVQLASSPQPARRASKRRGWGAGILALGVVLGAVAGSIWGIFRPEYVAVPHGDGLAVDRLASPDNIEFVSWAGFVALSTVVGLVVGLVGYAYQEHRSSAKRMAWVAAVALFSSWTLAVMGEVTAGKYAPGLQPGIGWLAGPFVAGLSYWVSMAAGFAAAEPSSPAAQRPATVP